MKFVLVINAPNNCYECPCSNEGCYLCQINRVQLNDDFQERRPNWCPLKPLPNRKEDLHYPCNEYLQAVNEGWNNCLDEITDHIGESTEKVCNDDLYESWMFFDEGETE